MNTTIKLNPNEKLNNTTIENNISNYEKLYEKYSNMNYQQLSDELDMMVIDSRVLGAEIIINSINSKTRMDEINRNLDKLLLNN